jgi:predicted nucleic acid-binding protein
MIVVSDTSPITALLTVGAESLLTQLFAEVVIPGAVRDELLRNHSVLPVWLRVEAPHDLAKIREFSHTVDIGEAEAKTLAIELRADRLLIDERKGRQLAAQHGVPIIGLLGIVLLSRKQELISSARVLLDQIEREAGMYLERNLKEAALDGLNRRRRPFQVERLFPSLFP